MWLENTAQLSKTQTPSESCTPDRASGKVSVDIAACFWIESRFPTRIEETYP